MSSVKQSFFPQSIETLTARGIQHVSISVKQNSVAHASSIFICPFFLAGKVHQYKKHQSQYN